MLPPKHCNINLTGPRILISSSISAPTTKLPANTPAIANLSDAKKVSRRTNKETPYAEEHSAYP